MYVFIFLVKVTEWPPIGKIQYSQRDVYILRAHARKKKMIKFHAKPTQNPRSFLAKSTLVPRYVHVHSSQEACELREI